MEHFNLKSSRTSRRRSHQGSALVSSSHHHFSGASNSGYSSTSIASSARFGLSSGVDRSQMGSPTGTTTAPSLSRLAIPLLHPHGHTNALHLACVNGDKQLVVKLVNSSSDSCLNVPTSSVRSSTAARHGSQSVRSSMNNLNINMHAAYGGSSSKIDVDAPDSFGRTPLMYCVLGNRLDCLEYLVKSTRANVNAVDNLGRTALHWAAHKEHHKLLKALIAKGGADCRAKDREGLTPFHLCMKNRSGKSAALIMKNLNANDIEEQDNYKRTALHLAAMYGSYEQVQMLLQRDANVGIPDGEGKTPLHYAINSKHQYSCAIVQSLVEHMPSVVNWQDHDGRTSLHLAVAEGSYNLVKTLIGTEGCKLACLDNMFRTPLHWAAVMDNASTAPQIVTLLLNKGCDWTCSDSNGATPLHYAAQKNNAETMRAFLQFGELTDQADIEGRTAFMWAAGAGSLETLDVMIDCGADLTQSDKNGATALHAAATSGNVNCVKLLLSVGCKMTADNMKLTPLSRAAELGHVAIAQLLIKHGAKLSQQDREGRYPLHWAAYGGSLRMCELLVSERQSRVNCSDYMGRTPLQYAAQKGFNNCISLLVQHGADPNLQDAQGRTALHWSCSLGHLDAVRLLLKCDAFPNYMEFSEERYTPLDYALLNSHHEVAQFMIENAGALSINGIREIAAAKIQAVFKGVRERRSFVERRTLLLKHDKIRKNKSSASNSNNQKQPSLSEQVYSSPEEKSGVPARMPAHSSRSGLSSEECNEADQDSERTLKLSQVAKPNLQVPDHQETFPMQEGEERRRSDEDSSGSQKRKVKSSAERDSSRGKSEPSSVDSSFFDTKGEEQKQAEERQTYSGTDRTPQTSDNNADGNSTQNSNSKKGTDRSSSHKSESEKLSKAESDSPRSRASPRASKASSGANRGDVRQSTPKSREGQTAETKSAIEDLERGNQSVNDESVVASGGVNEFNISVNRSQGGVNEVEPSSKSVNKLRVESPKSGDVQYEPREDSSSAISSRSIGSTRRSDGGGDTGKSGIDADDEKSCVSDYLKQRQASVLPFDVTADESRKRRSVDFKTPTCDWNSDGSENNLSLKSASNSEKSSSSDRSTDQRNFEHSSREYFERQFEDLDSQFEMDPEQLGYTDFDDDFEDIDASMQYYHSTDHLTASRNMRRSSTNQACTKNSPMKATPEPASASTFTGGMNFDDLLERQSRFKQIRLAEQARRAEIQRRNNAAKLIQRAWRAYGFKSKKFYKAFKEVFLLKRSIGQEQTLKKEVAALTIQLAWRRYYRRKMLASNNPYRTLLNKFSKEVRYAKQHFVESRIYSRQEKAEPFYGMKIQKPRRPHFATRLPYQSTLDFNFAVRQYKPPSVFYTQLNGVAPRRLRSAKHFSYNLRA